MTRRTSRPTWARVRKLRSLQRSGMNRRAGKQTRGIERLQSLKLCTPKTLSLANISWRYCSAAAHHNFTKQHGNPFCNLQQTHDPFGFPTPTEGFRRWLCGIFGRGKQYKPRLAVQNNRCLFRCEYKLSDASDIFSTSAFHVAAVVTKIW